MADYGDDRVSIAATRLAVAFTDDAKLPPRLRKSPGSAQTQRIKINSESESEKRLRVNVLSWSLLIEAMLSRINSVQAWRFIDLAPEVHPSVQEISACKDFCDFVDYLILRRDVEDCGSDELGAIAMLLTEFQREVEKKIQQPVAFKPKVAGGSDTHDSQLGQNIQHSKGEQRKKFVALDVETANPDVASICQIGIVQFLDGEPVDVWSSLIDPQDYFDDMNVSIHGIDRNDVRGAPTFEQIFSEIERRINGQVVAIHTGFDKAAIAKASLRHKVASLDCIWINTASVARRVWSDVSQRGYGLAALALKLEIDFEHHDAAEDARAAGIVLVRAMSEMGLDLVGMVERVRHPIATNSSDSMARAGNVDGPFHGEFMAFTGALTLPRRDAVELAAKAGCETTDGVTKHTTILVVGDQDIRALNGHEKSSKHRKAEEMISQGKSIRILTESDFLTMVSAS